MRKETQSNAQNTSERRLLRAVLPLHARASRDHQGGGQAAREYDRVRARADRRLPNHVRPARHSGGGARGRYEEPQNPDESGIRSPSTRTPVSEPSGAESDEIGQALSSCARSTLPYAPVCAVADSNEAAGRRLRAQHRPKTLSQS